jgi:hypothetical protein
VDVLDILRSQASRYQCPNCGKSLGDCRLDLLGREGSESLVKITCAHCEDSRMIAVAVAAEIIPAPVRDQPVAELGKPISADDVLDVKLALSDHSGDLKSLVGAA